MKAFAKLRLVLFYGLGLWLSPSMLEAQSLDDFNSRSFPLELPCETNFSEQKFLVTTQYQQSNQLLALQASALLEVNDPEFIKNTFEEWGFHGVHFIGPNRNGHSLAVAIRKEMTLVVHRGTRSVVDVLRDIQFLPKSLSVIPGLDGKSHSGFLRQYLELRKDLLKVLKSELDLGQNKPIYVTGHSLGGAVAAINALDLHKLGYLVKGLYTSAQPILGDQVIQGLLSYHIGDRYHRLIRSDDIVPQLPPPASIAPLFDDLKLGVAARFVRSLSYSHHPSPAYLADKQGKRSLVSPLIRGQMFWESVKKEYESDSLRNLVAKIMERPLHYLCSLGAAGSTLKSYSNLPNQ